MANGFPTDLLSSTLNILAVEDLPPDLVAMLTTKLGQATLVNEQGILSLCVDEHHLSCSLLMDR